MTPADSHFRNKLPEILHASAQELQDAFDKTEATNHKGMRGTSREEHVTEFLRGRLPRTVGVVGSEEVVAVDGSTSGQCDVLLVDPITPPFLVNDSHRIVPLSASTALSRSSHA